MKWLDLDYIKQHSRIDFDIEDELLELYGDSAENTILNITGRTYEELKGNENDVPAPIMHASLMLVEVAYTHRSPVSPQNMSVVPDTFDMLVKPYMKLTPKEEDEQ